VAQTTVRRFWSPSGIAGSTWCLGWDRPSPGASQAGRRWSRDGVGHLGFTGGSLWIDPARGRWVALVSNRVHPTRANDAIKRFRPVLHDAIVSALDG
jgi:CubicO group peptidase (beta-lactamase class C family)